MTVKMKFHYSVLRYRHDLITGEFLNVGLVLFSREANYFKAKMLNRYKRITATFPGADGEFLKSYLDRLQFEFDVIMEKLQNNQLHLFADVNTPDTLESLLNTVLPYDDSGIFFDRPISGVVENLDKFFGDLYDRLILHYIVDQERETRNDEDVWNVYRQPLLKSNVLSRLQSHVVNVSVDEIKFDHAWKNGKWKVLQPISFDLKIPTNIRKKGREWVGTTVNLCLSADLSQLYFLLGAPTIEDPAHKKAYEDSKDMLNLKNNGLKITIIEENEAEDFAKDISPIIQSETDNFDKK